MTFTIAIDGPAAAGKGTLSRRIAAHYGFHHLDTGLTYRAAAKAMLDAGLPLDNEAAAVDAARSFDMGNMSVTARRPRDRRGCLEDCRHAVGSQGAGRAPARIRDRPPGTVLDGRDIGTVVCPDAPVKLYVTASPEVRARRRYDEILGNGGEADLQAILADIVRRDGRDMNRAD